MLGLCLGFLLLISPIQADWVPLVKAGMKSVPRLEMIDEDGKEGVCSGVIINKKSGFVLTAGHCVDGKGVQLTVNDRHAEVARVNKILDLAVVRTTLRDSDEEMVIASESPMAGAEISVIGYPFGVSELAVQFGRVSQAYNKETKTIWINVAIIPGNSGGAIMDSTGKLVGITSRVYYSGPSVMGAAMPVDSIKDFVQPYEPVRGVK